MYVVVGLGNPGNEYRMTRHNIGFEVIDYMASQNNVKINKIKLFLSDTSSLQKVHYYGYQVSHLHSSLNLPL